VVAGFFVFFKEFITGLALAWLIRQMTARPKKRFVFTFLNMKSISYKKRVRIMRQEARRLAMVQMADFRAQLKPLRFWQRFNVLIRILFNP